MTYGLLRNLWVPPMWAPADRIKRTHCGSGWVPVCPKGSLVGPCGCALKLWVHAPCGSLAGKQRIDFDTGDVVIDHVQGNVFGPARGLRVLTFKG